MYRTLSLSLTLTLAAFALGCAQNNVPPQHIGEPLTMDDSNTITVAELMANREQYKGQRVRVKGKVHDLCIEKGCWMEITDGDNVVFVSGFAVCEDTERGVPLEAKDHEAVVEGVFKYVMVPEDKARHLAMDKGATEAEAAKIVGPQADLQITAAGADLYMPCKCGKMKCDKQCDGKCKCGDGSCDKCEKKDNAA